MFFANDFDEDLKKTIMAREKICCNIHQAGNIPIVFECQDKTEATIGERAILEHRKNK